jgi:hypothetical protein
LFDSGSKSLSPGTLATGITYLLLAFATLSVGIDLCVVARTASALPLLDHWMFLAPLAKTGSYSLSDLWAQHNEHRLVIPKLFYLADFYWFRGRNVSLFIAIFVVQALHALLLMRIADVSQALRPALFALIVAFLFSPVQLHNFVWEFQICFVLGAFLASACAWSFALFYRAYQLRTSPHRVVRLFILSLVLALCTTLSLANGLVLWPILAGILILLRVNWRYLFALAMVAAGVFAAYFQQWFTPDGHSHPLDSLRQPISLIQYVFCYLGGSWVNYGLTLATILGGVGAALGIFVLLRLWRTRAHLKALDIFVAITVLGTFATALETGLGRLDFGLAQASSSRYQTIALVYWAALGIWAVSKRPANSQWQAIAVFSLVVLAPFVRIADVVDPYSDWPSDFDDTAATMMSGVDDDDAVSFVWPMEGDIRPTIDLLRRRRKSVFSTQLSAKLGSRFSDSFHIDQRLPCPGEIRIARLLKEPNLKALKFTGLLQSPSPIRNLVLVDDKGRISGFGFNRNGAWLGYSRMTVYRRMTGASETVQVYGLLPDGSGACSIATFE